MGPKRDRLSSMNGNCGARAGAIRRRRRWPARPCLLLLIGWVLIYLLIYLPRGMVG